MPRRLLLPLNTLVALEAALRTGSISAAAKELGVTPAAVSQHIKSLEETYEIGFFERRAKGLAITAAGRRLLPRLSECFDALEVATAHLVYPSNEADMALSVLPSLAKAWVMPLLPSMQQRFPEIAWSVLTETRMANFKDDDVDLAIRYCVAPESTLVSQRLFGEDVFPVCSPALALDLPRVPTLHDIAACPLLHDLDAAGRGDAFDWDLWFDAAGIDRDERAECRFSDAALLLDAAEAGLGVALGRSPLVASRLREGRLVRLGMEVRASTRSYFVVTSRRNHRRAAVREVFDWFVQAAAQSATQMTAQ